MREIKIKYQYNIEPIVEWLDRAIRDAAEKEKWRFIGSGYDFVNNVRDLQFKKDLENPELLKVAVKSKEE